MSTQDFISTFLFLLIRKINRAYSGSKSLLYRLVTGIVMCNISALSNFRSILMKKMVPGTHWVHLLCLSLLSTNVYSQLLLDPTSLNGPLSNITATSGGVNSSIAQAYSIRALKTTYDHSAPIVPPTSVNGYTNATTPLLRVRRSFDSAELDIGYLSGYLDTVTLKNFVTGKIGANGATNTTANGYVSVWYDQSGNNRDAIQTTLANQPRIINAGVIDRNSSGQVGIVLDGTDQLYHGGSSYLVSPAGYNVYGITGNRCLNMVCQPRSWTNGSISGAGGTYLIDRLSGGSGTQEHPLTSIKVSNNNWAAQIRLDNYDITGSFEGSVGVSTNRSDNVSIMRSGDKYILYVNGINAGSTIRSGDNYMSPIMIGYGDGSPTEIYYGECILFPSSLTNANLNALNTSQDNFFATGPGPSTWTGAISSDWSTSGNWSNNTVPSTLSEITIPSNVGNTLIITAGQTTLQVKSMSIAAGATVTINGNLNVQEDVTINGSIDGTGSLTMNGGVQQYISTASGSGIVNLIVSNTADTVWASSDLTITGTLNIANGAVFGSTASYIINNTAAGTVTGNGTLLITRISGVADFQTQYRFSTYSLSGLTVTYFGAGNQTINLNNPGIIYGNLAVGGSGIKTMDYAITPSNVTGTSIVVYSGTLYTANYYITCPATMLLSIWPGATFDAGTSIIYFGTGLNILSIAGTFTTANTNGFSGAVNTSICNTNSPAISLGQRSTIHYNSSSAQTISSRSDYANITLSGSGLNKIPSGSITARGNVSINSGGVLYAGSSNITLNIGGNFINNGSIPIGAGSFSVTFNGTTPQTIGGSGAIVFRDFTFSGTSTVTLARDISIQGGNLTVNTGATLDMGMYTANRVSFGGSVTVSGTLVLGNVTGGRPGSNFPDNYSTTNVTAGTVEYNALNETYQSIYGTTYNNLILTNGSGSDSSYANKSLGDDIAVNGTFTVNKGALYYSDNIIGGSGTLTGYGTILLLHPMSAQFTIANRIFTNINLITFASTIDAGTYGNIQLNGSSQTFTLTGNIVVTGLMLINSGMTLDVSASNYQITVGGDWTNYGTFLQRNGTVVFNGSTKQSLTGTTTFNNVTLNKPGDTLYLNNTVNILGQFNMGTTNSAIVYAPSNISLNSTLGTATMSGAGKVCITNTAGIRTQYKFATYDLDSIDVIMANTIGSSTILLSGTPTLIYSNIIIATGVSASSAFETTLSASSLTKNLTVKYGKLNSSSNMTLSAGSIFTVEVDGNFSQSGGSTVVSFASGAAGSVVINGTVNLANTQGFSGSATTCFSSTNNPIITLGPASTVSYSSATTQIVQARSDYANVSISNGTKTIGAGTYTIRGSLTIAASSTWNGATNNPILNIAGNFTNNGTFTQGTGLVTFNGTTTQTIGGTTATPFSNSVTFGGSSTAQLTNSISLGGNLTVNTGKVLNLSTFTANRSSGGGTLTVAGTLQLGNNTGGQTGSNFPTNYSGFTVTGGTVEYNGSNGITQTVYSTTYNNLILTNGSGTGTANKISTGNIGIGSGVFTIGYGVKFVPNSSTTVNGSGGTLTGYGEIEVNGTATLTSQYNISNKTLTNLTVTYSGTGQNIATGTYNTLTIKGSGTKTLTGNVIVLGDVTISSGNTLDASAGNYAISVAGNWVNHGTFTPRTGTVTFNGISSQDIGGTATTAFRSITITNTSGPVTLSSGIGISGTFTLSGTGTLFTPSPTSVINSGGAAGTITGTGTLNITRVAATADLRNQYKFSTYTLSSMMVNYSGVGDQTINLTGAPTINYNTLTVSGSGIKTLDAAITSSNVTGDITVSSGTLSTGNFNIASPASRTITVATGATLDAGTSIISYGTTTKLLVINGTLRTSNTNGLAGSASTAISSTNTPTISLAAASTIEFYSGSAQAINTNVTGVNYGNIFITGNSVKTFSSGFTGSKVSGKITINNGTSTVVLGGASTIVCPLTLTSGKLVIGNNTLTLADSVVSNSTNCFVANGSSNITYSGAGGTSSLFLDQTTPGTTNALGTLTVNRIGNSLALGTTTQVNTALVLTNGDLSIGALTLTLNGTVSASASNTILANGSSILTIGGSGALGSSLFFNQTTPGTSNKLATFSVARSGQTITLGNNLIVGGALNITGGKLAIGNTTLSIEGSLTSDASNSISANGINSSLAFTNTGNSTFYLDQTAPGTTNQLETLTLNRSGNTVTIGSNTIVSSLLNLTSGKLAIGSSTLSINGNISHNATNCIVGGSSSSLTFAGASGNLSVYLDQTTPGITNQLNTLTINRTGSVISLANDAVISSLLQLTDGKLAIGSNTLTLNGSQTTTAANCIQANGFSSLAIAGSSSFGSSLFFDQTTDGITNSLNNLSFNRIFQTITLGNTLKVTGVVTPTSGTVASGGFLTLVSNNNGTARIANGGCTTCSYLTGNVIVQRFIPGVARRWRFTGSPVQSATLADWKNEVFITGTGGVSNGFDASSSNAATVYWYDETVTTGNLNTGWVAATNISNPLSVGRGYRLFIRGDRGDTGRLTGATPGQNAVTLDLVGNVNKGDIVMPVTFSSSGTLSNDGWNFLSNPYPSPYDWNAHADNGAFQTNIDPTIYILSAQTGGYVAYNAGSNAGTLTNGIIPAGAGFWVKATGASPSLTFKEQFKVGTNHLGLFKTGPDDVFSIKLQLDSITSDELLIKYNASSTINADGMDILKLAGTVNISSYANDNVQLSLSVRPSPATIDTIKLSISGEAGNYKLLFSKFEALTFTQTAQLLLIDTYLSIVTDVTTTTEYAFSILPGIASSQGPGRFYLIVNNTSTALPVNFLCFDGQLTTYGEVELTWTVAQEINCDRYLIQRSSDNNTYETIGQVKGGRDHTQQSIRYQYSDTNPNALNYYRLKQIDSDGSFCYSPVRLIQLDTIIPRSVSVYPTQVDETITVRRTLTEYNSCSITLTNLSGIAVKHYPHLQWVDNTITLNLSNLAQGFYILRIEEHGNDQPFTFKFTKH